jgi:hypothetical protein
VEGDRIARGNMCGRGGKEGRAVGGEGFEVMEEECCGISIETDRGTMVDRKGGREISGLLLSIEMGLL